MCKLILNISMNVGHLLYIFTNTINAKINFTKSKHKKDLANI